MAEYVSSYICLVVYDDGTGEFGPVPGYYVTFGFYDVGLSVGGDAETFSVGDVIAYEDSIGLIDLDYFGFVGGGWVGREECGCGEYDYYLITNDGFVMQGERLDIVEETFTVCFLAGTAIACPGGARPVEDLAVGDLVLTADGDVRPVRFVGRQSFATLFADPCRTRPVRIAAGALGDGLPLRDLCVSPDHALLVDGALVQAGALVNGTTIAPMTDLPARFTYFHVELDDHALILAEGVPAETFVDNVTRRRFDNYADYVALYGEGTPTIAEMALPRVKSARQLPHALRRRLAAGMDDRSDSLAA
jgi:hypothetical protein